MSNNRTYRSWRSSRKATEMPTRSLWDHEVMLGSRVSFTFNILCQPLFLPCENYLRFCIMWLKCYSFLFNFLKFVYYDILLARDQLVELSSWALKICKCLYVIGMLPIVLWLWLWTCSLFTDVTLYIGWIFLTVSSFVMSILLSRNLYQNILYWVHLIITIVFHHSLGLPLY